MVGDSDLFFKESRIQAWVLLSTTSFFCSDLPQLQDPGLTVP